MNPFDSYSIHTFKVEDRLTPGLLLSCDTPDSSRHPRRTAPFSPFSPLPRFGWQKLAEPLLPTSSPATSPSPVVLSGGGHGRGSAAPAIFLVKALISSGIGAFVGSQNVMLGEMALGYGLSEASCKHIGAVGGAILAIPGFIVLTYASNVYFVSEGAIWRRTISLFTLMFAVYVGFGALGGLVGWKILHQKEDIQLEVGKVVVIATLGSVFTSVISFSWSGFVVFWSQVNLQ